MQETQGVFVTSYQSDDKDFPAFYTRKSGVKAPYNISDPIEAAKLISTAKTLNLDSGILIAVPVPQEFAMNGALFYICFNNYNLPYVIRKYEHADQKKCSNNILKKKMSKCIYVLIPKL